MQRIISRGSPHTLLIALHFSFSQAALWLHGIAWRRHFTGPRAGRDAAARAAATHLAIVLSNRDSSGGPAFVFRVVLEGVPASGPAPAFAGHAYAPNATDAPLGTVTATLDSYDHWVLELGVPSLSVQFWLQQ